MQAGRRPRRGSRGANGGRVAAVAARGMLLLPVVLLSASGTFTREEDRDCLTAPFTVINVGSIVTTPACLFEPFGINPPSNLLVSCRAHQFISPLHPRTVGRVAGEWLRGARRPCAVAVHARALSPRAGHFDGWLELSGGRGLSGQSIANCLLFISVLAWLLAILADPAPPCTPRRP